MVGYQRNQQPFRILFKDVQKAFEKSIALAVTGPAKAIDLGEESGAAPPGQETGFRCSRVTSS